MKTMVHLKWLLFGCVAALGLTACLPSLQPAYTEKDLAYDPKLVGSWSEKEDPSAPWVFTARDEKSYDLVIHNDGKKSPFQAHLFRLGGNHFLDILPDDSAFEESQTEEFYRAALIPGHLFFKVSLAGEELKLHVLELEWVENLLKNDPKAIAHSVLDGKRIVFTASTEELQKFLVRYAKDEKAWGEPAVFVKAPAGKR